MSISSAPVVVQQLKSTCGGHDERGVFGATSSVSGKSWGGSVEGRGDVKSLLRRRVHCNGGENQNTADGGDDGARSGFSEL